MALARTDHRWSGRSSEACSDCRTHVCVEVMVLCDPLLICHHVHVCVTFTCAQVLGDSGSAAAANADGEPMPPIKKYNKSSFFDEVSGFV